MGRAGGRLVAGRHEARGGGEALGADVHRVLLDACDDRVEVDLDTQSLQILQRTRGEIGLEGREQARSALQQQDLRVARIEVEEII